MITKHSALDHPAGGWRCGLARTLRSLAFIVLLSVIAARCFVGEFGVRVSQVSPALAAAQSSGQVQLNPDTREIARVGFATVLLAAIAMWALAGAIEGKLSVRFGLLGLLIIAFGASAYFSARYASDQRAAINGLAEQISLLGAGFLAIQLCGDRKRFAQLVVVLAAVGGALAVKGLYQYFVEFPGRLADFDMNRAAHLSQMGWADGTPQAEMIRIRLADRSPTGFFSLINLYASLLVILLACSAGLAASKIACALRDYPLWRKTRKKGDVHLASLAAGLSCGVVVAVAVALLVTSSMGAIGAAFLAGLLAVAVVLFGETHARHWKKAVLVAACMAVLVGAAVVGHGIKHDSLPSKTMTFRWYYWTGAAEVIRENPTFGVGPGNFPAAYLQHRRPAAEEEVKNPHNFPLHAIAQFGLVGGLMFIAAVGFVLVNLVRPGPSDSQQEQASNVAKRSWILFVVVAFAPLAAMLAIAPDGLFIDTALAAIVFWLMLVAAGWRGGLKCDFNARALRIGLACGCIGFAVHNLITFSFWAPATALVFWVCSGACVGLSGRERVIKSASVRWASFVLLVLVAASVIVYCFAPARARWNINRDIYRSLLARDTAGAISGAIKLGQADPLDGLSASEASKYLQALNPRQVAPESIAALSSPFKWAREAVSRDPLNYNYHAMAGRLSGRQGQDKVSLSHFAETARLNPQNIRVRLDYAEMLYNFRLFDECIVQLDKAMEIDAAIPAGSVEHFNADELAEIKMLRQRSGG